MNTIRTPSLSSFGRISRRSMFRCGSCRSLASSSAAGTKPESVATPSPAAKASNTGPESASKSKFNPLLIGEEPKEDFFPREFHEQLKQHPKLKDNKFYQKLMDDREKLLVAESLCTTSLGRSLTLDFRLQTSRSFWEGLLGRRQRFFLPTGTGIPVAWKFIVSLFHPVEIIRTGGKRREAHASLIPAKVIPLERLGFYNLP